jgi:hypothetical protein
MRLFIYIPIWMDQIWTFNLLYIYADWSFLWHLTTCFPFMVYLILYTYDMTPLRDSPMTLQHPSRQGSPAPSPARSHHRCPARSPHRCPARSHLLCPARNQPRSPPDSLQDSPLESHPHSPLDSHPGGLRSSLRHSLALVPVPSPARSRARSRAQVPVSSPLLCPLYPSLTSTSQSSSVRALPSCQPYREL